MPNDRRSTEPTPVGASLRVRGVIWPIRIPAIAGLCACEFSAGAVSSCGRLLCLSCGQEMSTDPRAIPAIG